MPETSHANRLHKRCIAFVVAQSENSPNATPMTRYAAARRSTMRRLRLLTEASMCLRPNLCLGCPGYNRRRSAYDENTGCEPNSNLLNCSDFYHGRLVA